MFFRRVCVLGSIMCVVMESRGQPRAYLLFVCNPATLRSLLRSELAWSMIWMSRLVLCVDNGCMSEDFLAPVRNLSTDYYALSNSPRSLRVLLLSGNTLDFRAWSDFKCNCTMVGCCHLFVILLLCEFTSLMIGGELDPERIMGNLDLDTIFDLFTLIRG